MADGPHNDLGAEAAELRETLTAHHRVKPGQVFVGKAGLRGLWRRGYHRNAR